MPENNLTVLPPEASEYPLLRPDNMQQMLEVFQQNIGPSGISTLDLPRIKVAPGDLLLWKIQTLDGDETAKEIEGIILSWRTARLYWKTDPNEAGAKKKPPDCTSTDGYVGVGDPGGECSKCPYAQFGSSPKGGRGQACKQIRQLLLVRPGEALPYLIAVPPTSLKNVSQYFLMLWSRGVPYWGVVSKLKLEKAVNEGSIAYGKITFNSVRRLLQPEQDVLRPYQEKMGHLLAPMAIDTADYEHVAGDDDAIKSAPRSWKEREARQARQAEAETKGDSDEIPF